MGFGFNLGMIFIILPLSGLLLILWLITKKSLFVNALGIIWGLIVILVLISGATHFIFDKKKLKHKDFYGTYVIDRGFFKGKQADWQYDHFRFEITKDDSIFFYVTDKEEIKRTYKGTISTLKQYYSERLVINMEKPTHHIMISNPTIYRETWDFYLVFNSSKFYNMYFRKGIWRSIE
ncbi:hypothetical protein [Plebeiibacterium sediminum]|uniref:Uncharacterized protein n=1 Tax=Plebeiibacterium sediminum TaxID=2992112 RepID=A0AAE3SGW5_9BACT|nr:hypothetical protein [Plebeiobacterium sediminum]MCW3788925.1 hypothetical protein [Plebeiobacterium sediminum]